MQCAGSIHAAIIVSIARCTCSMLVGSNGIAVAWTRVHEIQVKHKDWLGHERVEQNDRHGQCLIVAARLCEAKAFQLNSRAGTVMRAPRVPPSIIGLRK